MASKSPKALTRTDPQTHQTDDLSAELQRLESRLRAEESRTREVSGQFKACQEQLAEANRKLEAMEIAAKLDEVVSKVKICKPSESTGHSKITPKSLVHDEGHPASTACCFLSTRNMDRIWWSDAMHHIS
jgi:hypothetical protein